MAGEQIKFGTIFMSWNGNSRWLFPPLSGTNGNGTTYHLNQCPFIRRLISKESDYDRPE